LGTFRDLCEQTALADSGGSVKDDDAAVAVCGTSDRIVDDSEFRSSPSDRRKSTSLAVPIHQTDVQ